MECLAFRRDRGRDRHHFGEEVFDLLAEVVLEQADHLEEEHQALQSCLQKLPSDHRSLLESAYAPGVKIESLARTLNRTPMAVYKTLHRIRLILMECTQRILTAAEPT
jgi:RNA polymerase sigma-70 factor (ECF subfamily)